ncbi:MAG: helicase-associated domain-containing protein [Planctomycetota bacterium]
MSLPRPDNPLIVQSDRTLMLHTVRIVIGADGLPAKDAEGRPVTEEHPRFAEARDALAVFAELEKSPDYLHTYRLTPVSVWNAAATGVTADAIEAQLLELSCVPVPPALIAEVRGWIARYGLLRIERNGDGPRPFELCTAEPATLADVLGHSAVRDCCTVDAGGRVWLDDLQRGAIKQALIKLGYPVDDRGGYIEGDALAIRLRDATRGGAPFGLRPYQEAAAAAFHAGGTVLGGSGVVVLPCGAGKTVTGMAVMSLVGTKTLILTTNTVAVRQWRDELLDKTELTTDDVGEYTGDGKEVKPVTISTYQMLTWRRDKDGAFEHFEIFRRQNWGLVVYDEVHLLPAPIFRVTADLQARRRLGLTATLVREDGKEDEVFCLIGPKRYDVPWKVLESQGFIAEARCVEVRVSLSEEDRKRYAAAATRAKFRVASENPAKIPIVERLVRRHDGERVLIIGQYIEQLLAIAQHFDAPVITGKTPNPERERLYDAFRTGTLKLLVVSKVGNFAIDLPDASVAIQVSGTFGSRQEEAQRLGRILRPKADGHAATFYSVVTLATRDQEFAEKRQLFLTEQGYAYDIVEAETLLSTSLRTGKQL